MFIFSVIDSPFLGDFLKATFEVLYVGIYILGFKEFLKATFEAFLMHILGFKVFL